MHYISVIPANQVYYSSVRTINWHDNFEGWGPWLRVIAWGFVSNDSRALPITIFGCPTDDQEWQIKMPNGEEVRV